MNPIIDPNFFYWVHVISNTRDVLATISVVLIMGCGLYKFVLWFLEQPLKFKVKPYIITSIILAMITNFMPTKDVMYQMMTAHQITPDNIELVGGTAKDSFDYIIESIDKLIKENETDDN